MEFSKKLFIQDGGWKITEYIDVENNNISYYEMYYLNRMVGVCSYSEHASLWISSVSMSSKGISFLNIDYCEESKEHCIKMLWSSKQLISSFINNHDLF